MFSDAPFANNTDSSTQLGYVVFYVDATNTAHCVQHSSLKINRVVHSVLGGELLAMDDAIDYATRHFHDLCFILTCHPRIEFRTYSLSIFNILLHQLTVTTEND